MYAVKITLHNLVLLLISPQLFEEKKNGIHSAQGQTLTEITQS